MNLSIGRLGVVCAAVLALHVGGAVPAAAHASLESVTPASGASLDASPVEVVLTFNDEMNRPSFVTVTAPDGSVIARGEATVDGTAVRQPLGDPGVAGAYRVDYRVVSADGHPISGSYRYVVTSGTPASGDATSEEEPADRRLRYWVIGIALWLVLMIGAGLWVRRRR